MNMFNLCQNQNSRFPAESSYRLQRQNWLTPERNNFSYLSCQCFLFLLELRLGLIFGSWFNWSVNDFPTAQLHKALSTSDGVKESPSELNSCKWFFHQMFKKPAKQLNKQVHSSFVQLMQFIQQNITILVKNLNSSGTSSKHKFHRVLTGASSISPTFLSHSSFPWALYLFYNQYI